MYIFSDVFMLLSFIVHFCFVVMAYFVCRNKSKELDVVLLLSVGLFYVFLVLSRNGFGVDESTYRNAYESYIASFDSFEFEYSFRFIYYILFCFDVSPNDFNNVICFLYIFFACFVIMKTVQSPYRSLCFLFFMFSSVSLDFIFNAYRQGFSFLSMFLSISLFERNKKSQSLLWLIVAIGFHWSVVIVLMSFVVAKFLPRKDFRWWLSILMLITVVAFTTPIGILAIISDWFTQFSFGSFYADKVQVYLLVEKFTIYDLNFFGRLPFAINALVLLIFVMVFSRCIAPFWVVFVILLNLYCVLFLEMSYGYRNYYWVTPFFAFLTVFVLEYYERRNLRINMVTGFFCCVHILITLTTYYTSPIIKLVFIH